MALIPRDGDDADGLLRAVDVALRVAKRTGRHQLSVYAGESFSDNGPGGARETLERLISGEGLAIVVQPIVSTSTGTAARLRGAGALSDARHHEPVALVRARRRVRGPRPPRAGLPAAPRSALLPDRPAGTSLSVNLSGPLLLDPRTSACCRQRGALDGLILELTENSLLEDTPGLHAAISRLLALRGALRRR